MFNRPQSTITPAAQPPSLRSELSLDRKPLLRLLVLFGVLVAPFGIVAARLGQLQTIDADDFAVGLEPKFAESFESIPTTDGRILMGGSVMARDTTTYRLKLHYRWLEEPADEHWLTRRAQATLNKADRRNKAKIEAAKEQLLAERQRMWERLIDVIGIEADEFAKRRQAIQARVEKLVARVELKHAERRRDQDAEQQRELDEQLANQKWWETAETIVRRELTTPPRRPQTEPIIVQEELSYHIIAEDIPFERISDVMTNAALFPGLDFEVTTRRDYPQGPLAAHFIGVRRVSESPETEPVATTQDLERAEFWPDDRRGVGGLEGQYDRWLKGRRGLRRVVRNADGEIVQREIVRQPRPGADIEMSLIEPLQRACEKLLDDVTGTHPALWSKAGSFIPNAVATQPEDDPHDRSGENAPAQPIGGCVIALNVATGEIIAAAAAPRFDQRLYGDFDPELWERLLADPQRPLFPRVTQMQLAPGSVFKTMTAIAALEDHKLGPNDVITCTGYFKDPSRHRCMIFKKYGTTHGAMQVTDALCWSCNVFFFEAASRLGTDRLAHWSQKLGFGQPTGIDVAGEVSGHIPAARIADYIQLAAHTEAAGQTNHRRVTSAASRSSRAVDNDTLGFGIGQGTVTVTPLQIVRLMAAVANGGQLVQPHVVNGIVDRRPLNRRSPLAAAGDVGRDDFPPLPKFEARSSGISERTLHIVRQGLELVVSKGTGFGSVRMKEVAIAGKTGTAETGGGRPDHAWFAGYVPADQPQIAFVVVLEHGGSGAKAAGPIAHKLVEELLQLGVIAQ